MSDIPVAFNNVFRELAVRAALQFEGFFEDNRHGYDPKLYAHTGEGQNYEWDKAVGYIGKHYDEYGRVPSMDLFLGNTSWDLNRAPVDANDLPALRDKLVQFARYHAVLNAMEATYDHQEAMEFDKILPEFEKAADLDTGQALEILNLKRDRDEIIQRIKYKSDRMVPTGWRSLDDRFGGWEPGTISAVAARTGTGKTVWLCNAALNLAKAGKNVLLLSLEMPGADIGGRTMRMLTGCKTHGRMSAHDYIALAEGLDKADDAVMERLNIAQMIAPSASQIAAEVRRLKRKGYLFDAIVMDYMDLCEPDETKAKKNEIWLADKAMTWELKLFTEREQLVFLTAFQTNRNIDNRKPGDEYTANMVAGGSEKSRAATNLMFLERMDNDAEIKEVAKQLKDDPENSAGLRIPERRTTGYKLYYTKIRNGMSGGFTEFSWNPDYMLITELKSGGIGMGTEGGTPNPKDYDEWKNRVIKTKKRRM